MTEPQSVALIREALEAGPTLAPIVPCICEFYAWIDNPYTKVLQKSIADDYVPKVDADALEADAQRYRTWLAYAFSDEEGTETFLIDTPEKMQEWLDKRAAAARGETF